MAAKKFPIGIQSFEDIVEGGYAYIDKTALVYNLVTEGKVFFLSRPRRFGKSLLVSTLEAYFQGRRELFRGLAIEKLEQDWICYPVIHLDMSGQAYDNPEALEQILLDKLSQFEQIYGASPTEVTAALKLGGIIRRACEQTGRKVAVLIDEYDKPVLEAIGNEELADQYRRRLKGFYGVLKSADPYLKFVLLTGVTKFSQVSVFSDLNQLRDISMLPKYDTICGITEQELETGFHEDLSALAEAEQRTYPEMIEYLRRKYDGYHFSEAMHGVYNPFSILNVLNDKLCRDYWFQTGTPTYLMELLKRSSYDITNIEGVRLSPGSFADYRANTEMPIPMIYQSGYLTIKGYDRDFNEYTLGYPNGEVKNGFLSFIAPAYVDNYGSGDFSTSNFARDLRDGHVDAFMTRLQSLIASMNYELFDKNLKEKYFQTIFYLVFSLVGAVVRSEVHTSSGSIDAVVETRTNIYLFEFKMDRTPEEALRQIEDKRYADRYQSDSRPVTRIGASFSSISHRLEKWIVS
ncbi:MAG: ATP-binding protein [Bacteroidaceae bacterium]|nr:ATP-binding protein [Bacteroidaceae bacterium]